MQRRGDLLNREIFLSGPGINNAEIAHDVRAVECILCNWSQFARTAALAEGFLFSSQAGIDQTEHAQRRSLIGSFANRALDFGARRGKRISRCRVVPECPRHTTF